MERQKADSIWAEENPKMRAANNNLEHMFKFQEVGPPSVGQGGGESKGLQGYWCHTVRERVAEEV